MRRVVVALALLASLIIAASPTLASSETWHYRNYGKGLFAGWANIPWDAEVLPPGDYFATTIDASSVVVANGDTAGNGVCLSHWSFTVDKRGRWVDETWFGGCGEASLLAIDRLLASGRVVADFELQDCVAWDEQTGECLEWASFGTLAVDLTVRGDGPLYRRHGTSTGGVAGFYQYTSHGSGLDRNGIPSGSVTLDGVSLIAGATTTGGSLWSFKDGGTEIVICNQRTGC